MRNQSAPSEKRRREDWGTPIDLFTTLECALDIDFDAAATPDNALMERYLSSGENNAFTADWRDFGRTAYLNPPYGRKIGNWLDLAIRWRDHGVNTLALIPVSPDTFWWKRAVWGYATRIWFLEGRLRFRGATSAAPFASALVWYAPNSVAPLTIRGIRATMVERWKSQAR